MGCHRLRGEWLPETRPARSRFEFSVRTEERLSAADTFIDPRFMIIPIFAREGALGSFFASDLVLLRGQLSFPFLVGFGYFVGHGLSRVACLGGRSIRRLRPREAGQQQPGKKQ